MLAHERKTTGPEQKHPVGLLAGSGRFPVLFAEKASALNIPIVCTAIYGEASEQLLALSDRFYWISVAQMGRMIRLFRRAGVVDAVMAGKVQKTRWHNTLFGLLRYWPDWRSVRLYLSKNRKDNNDDSLMYALINECAKDGIRFMSALDYCPELLVKNGVLTKRKPTAKEQADIDFGWELAKEMGRLDVGQSVSVKDRSTLAIEAIEGTDRSIARAGELCRAGGFVVVKVAKPQQDMRFDVPTIGEDTIETMREAGAKVLAIEAEKTIVIDEEKTLALANRYGLSIVAVDRQAA